MRHIMKQDITTTNSVLFEESAILFETLAEKIYTTPDKSAVREIIANALDIHRVTKQTKKPKVGVVYKGKEYSQHKSSTLYMYEITVRDYGTGIKKEDYSDAFTFFKSSKNESGITSGAYGLGIKSPYGLLYRARKDGYSNNSFYITTYIGGQMTAYIHYINDNGIPSWDMLFDVPSNEPNGTEITFTVASNANLGSHYIPIISDITTYIAYRDKIEIALVIPKNTDTISDVNEIDRLSATGQYNNYKTIRGVDVVMLRQHNNKLPVVLFKKGDILYNDVDVSHDWNILPSNTSNVVYRIAFIIDVDVHGIYHDIGSSRESISVCDSSSSSDHIRQLINNVWDNYILPNSIGVHFAEHNSKIISSLKYPNNIRGAIEYDPDAGKVYDFMIATKPTMFPIILNSDSAFIREYIFPIDQAKLVNGKLLLDRQSTRYFNDTSCAIWVDRARYKKEVTKIISSGTYSSVFITKDVHEYTKLKSLGITVYKASEIVVDVIDSSDNSTKVDEISRFYMNTVFTANKTDVNTLLTKTVQPIYYVDHEIITHGYHSGWIETDFVDKNIIGVQVNMFGKITVKYKLDDTITTTMMAANVLSIKDKSTGIATKNTIDKLINDGSIQHIRDLAVTINPKYLSKKDTLLHCIVYGNISIMSNIRRMFNITTINSGISLFGIEDITIGSSDIINPNSHLIIDQEYANTLYKIVDEITKGATLASEIIGLGGILHNKPQMLLVVLNEIADKIDLFGLNGIIKEHIDKEITKPQEKQL